MRGSTNECTRPSGSFAHAEPTIGHMKTESKLDRNWLKGALGDAVHAVLCGAGLNLRMLMNKVKSATHHLVTC